MLRAVRGYRSEGSKEDKVGIAKKIECQVTGIQEKKPNSSSVPQRFFERAVDERGLRIDTSGTSYGQPVDMIQMEVEE